MGLLGHIFQHGQAVGQHRSQHGVHGSAHGDRIEEHMRTLQLLALHLDHAVLHRVGRAQGAERFQVLVNGAGAKVAAAGHGHLGRAETAQQRAQKIIAGAHLAGQIVRHLCTGQAGGINLIGMLIQQPHLCTQGGEGLQRNGHVVNVGHIFQHTFIGGQNGRGQQGHRCIFRTADGHFAHQGLAAPNDKLFQAKLSFGPDVHPPHRGAVHPVAGMGQPAAHQLIYYTPPRRKMKVSRVLLAYRTTTIHVFRRNLSMLQRIEVLPVPFVQKSTLQRAKPPKGAIIFRACAVQKAIRSRGSNSGRLPAYRPRESQSGSGCRWTGRWSPPGRSARPASHTGRSLPQPTSSARTGWSCRRG